MRSLVLASSSHARAGILRSVGLKFSIEPSAVDEGALKTRWLAEGASVALIAERLAAAKALDRASEPETLVIGADQTLEFDGRLLDKTTCLSETRERLRALRGRDFRLHCAVAGATEGAVVWSHSETARLAFRDFSETYLEDYLQRNASALRVSLGGFELESEGAQLLERADGDYFAILGLPLLPLLSWLRQAGGAPL